MFNALAEAPVMLILPTLNTYRCLYGLPGSQIPLDPHTFAPERQFKLDDRVHLEHSSQYRRIVPLHWKFHHPLINSNFQVLSPLLAKQGFQA